MSLATHAGLRAGHAAPGTEQDSSGRVALIDSDNWASWAAALEDALQSTAALDRGELEARHRAYLERPAGHDHHH